MNRKRVHRVWRQAHLQVKRRTRSQSRRERPLQRSAAYPKHIWAYDVVQDQDKQGTTLYILTVLDACTREGLAIDAALFPAAERVIGVLAALIVVWGAPVYLRSDNGAECVAQAVQRWLAEQCIPPLSIVPGKPWQNGKDERFNGTLRDACLNMHLFASLFEARVRRDVYRQHDNHARPHSRLGYQTPIEFKQAWLEAHVEQPDSLIPT